MKQFTTSSDAGSVKVGNENFTVLIPNGYGDGLTNVYVLEENENICDFTKEANYFTRIEGTFNIYDDDCWKDPTALITLKGGYSAWYFNGEVWLKKEE